MGAKTELATCPVRTPTMVFNEQRGYPNHVKEIMTWIGENRPEFDSLTRALDKNIGMFNEFGKDDFDGSYQNFHMVKSVLGGRPLPTVESLIAQAQKTPAELKAISADLEANSKTHVTWLPLLYARTLIKINVMMKRGDQKATGELPVDGPSIGYQNTPTDTRNLVVASIFQVYEEVVKSLPEFRSMDFEPDRIIEALMEVSTEDLALVQTLFRPLASRTGMNWVEGSDRFSPEFKKTGLGLIK